MKNVKKILGCIYSTITVVAILGYIYKDAIYASWERGEGILASFIMQLLTNDSDIIETDIESEFAESAYHPQNKIEDSRTTLLQAKHTNEQSDPIYTKEKNKEDESNKDSKDDVYTNKVCPNTEFLIKEGPFPEKPFIVSQCPHPQEFLHLSKDKETSCLLDEQNLFLLNTDYFIKAISLCYTIGNATYEAQKRIVLNPGDTVAFIGDGELFDVARIASKYSPRIKIRNYGKIGTGLLYHENGYITEQEVASASKDTKAVVIMAGRNDVHSILDSKPWIIFGKPEWDEYYRTRIASIIAVAKEKSTNVIWVLLPKTDDQVANYKAKMLNRLFKIEVEKAGAIIIDPNINFKNEEKSSTDQALNEIASSIHDMFIWPNENKNQEKNSDIDIATTDTGNQKNQGIERIAIDSNIPIRLGDRILFVGDEMLHTMQKDLQNDLEKLGIKAEFWTRSCIGYWPNSYSEWQQSLSEHLSKNRRFTHIAFFLGTHDRYTYEQNGEFARYGSSKWHELYLQHINKVLEIAGRYGLKVILGSSPKIQGFPSSLPVNETIHTAALNVGAAYVDTSKGPNITITSLLERMKISNDSFDTHNTSRKEFLMSDTKSDSKDSNNLYSEEHTKDIDLANLSASIDKTDTLKSSNGNNSHRKGCHFDVVCLLEGDLVLLVGDSMMQGTAPPLMKLLKNMGLKSANHSKQSTGLLTRNGTDWSKETRKYLNENSSIKLVVVMLGANDPWAMPTSSGRYAKFGSNEWKELYKTKVDALYSSAKEHGAEVIWIKVPRVRNVQLDKGIAIINELLQKEAIANHGYWVDTDFLSNENGEFSMYAVLNGKKVKARADDGVHFTPSGATAIAQATTRLIEIKSSVEGK